MLLTFECVRDVFDMVADQGRPSCFDLCVLIKIVEWVTGSVYFGSGYVFLIPSGQGRHV